MKINKSSLSRLKKLNKTGVINYSKISRELGESRQVVNNWIIRGLIPDEKVCQFSKLVGFEIKGKLSGRNAHVRLCDKCKAEIL